MTDVKHACFGRAPCTELRYVTACTNEVDRGICSFKKPYSRAVRMILMPMTERIPVEKRRATPPSPETLTKSPETMRDS